MISRIRSRTRRRVRVIAPELGQMNRRRGGSPLREQLNQPSGGNIPPTVNGHHRHPAPLPARCCARRKDCRCSRPGNRCRDNLPACLMPEPYLILIKGINGDPWRAWANASSGDSSGCRPAAAREKPLRGAAARQQYGYCAGSTSAPHANSAVPILSLREVDGIIV